MKSLVPFLVTVALALFLTTYATFAQASEIKLKDGSKWRGKVTDQVELTYRQQNVDVPLTGTLTKIDELFIVIQGRLGDQSITKTIFKADIVAMKTVAVGDGANQEPAIGDGATRSTGGSSVRDAGGNGAAPVNPAMPGERPLGVFVLPLSGTVGEGLRHEEIEAVGKEADKYGHGQIIVLEIESGGGLGIEMEKIHFTIKELKKRHRVVAWIKEAISAAAATASNCDEIYFYTTGTLGAMTGFAGGVSLKGEELRKWLDAAGLWMETGGRSKYIAWAMIDDQALLSYDVDPVSGKVKWHNDLSGEFVLSDEKTNLVFTASTATHSKFADGIADTQAELAKHLDLPEWREVSDYGRRIAKEWMATVEKAKEEIPLIFARLQYEGTGSNDQTVVIGKQIQNREELVRWWDRAPNVCFLSGVPPKEELERQITNLRRQLARSRDR